MSGGPNPRFPRTAGSIVQGRPTIEREKIRHRRPSDKRAFDAVDNNDLDQEPPSYQADEAASPWSQDDEGRPDQQEDWTAETEDWDNDADDEWVFENTSPDETVADNMAAGNIATDDGVIWEDDDIEVAPSDGRQGLDDAGEGGFAPEVELAARRDIRPRPPKPRSKQQNRATPVDQQKLPPASRVQQQYTQEKDTVALDARPAPMRRVASGQAQAGGRFARTQATIEDHVDPVSPKRRQPPPQQNRRTPSRRLPPQPQMVVPPARGRSRSRRRLMTLAMIALLVGGGWFVYQELGGQDVKGLIQAWGQKLGLPGSGRTAADTAFGSTDPAKTTIPPEDALADLASKEAKDKPTTEVFSLEDNSQTGSQAGGPLTPEQDPATIRTDGPPIPKFKPRDNAPIKKTNEEPSTLEQIWGYLVQG